MPTQVTKQEMFDAFDNGHVVQDTVVSFKNFLLYFNEINNRWEYFELP